jgi:hypothetical protein
MNPTKPNADQVEPFVHPMVRAYIDARIASIKDECEMMVRSAHKAVSDLRTYLDATEARLNINAKQAADAATAARNQLAIIDRMAATKLGFQRLAKELGIDLNE